MLAKKHSNATVEILKTQSPLAKRVSMSCLCIFAGESSGTRPSYSESTSTLGRMLGARGYQFVYGGGRTGLMGAFATGAIETGGHVTGIIPDFLDSREIGHTDVQSLQIVSSMHDRKAKMYEMADGIIILQGGLGTLDELMEVLTWNQLGLLNTPLFFLNTESFWQPLFHLLHHTDNEGFVHSRKVGTLHQHKNAHDLAEIIENILPPRR